MIMSSNFKLIAIWVYGLILVLFGIFILIKPEIVAYLIGILFILSWINAILIFVLFFAKQFFVKNWEKIVKWEYKVLDKEKKT